MKKLLKYQLSTSWVSLAVFAVVYLGIMAFAGISVSFSGGDSYSQMNGTEMAVGILCFVIFVSNYGDNMRLAIQNGRSRKSIYTAALASAGLGSMMLSLYAQIIIFASSLLFGSERISYISMTEVIYDTNRSMVGHFIENYIFTTALLLVTAMFALVLAAAFARAGKYGRVAIAAGVPIALFVGFPILSGIVVSKAPALSEMYIRLLAKVTGVESGNPYIGSLTMIIAAAVMALITYFINRRAELKG